MKNHPYFKYEKEKKKTGNPRPVTVYILKIFCNPNKILMQFYFQLIQYKAIYKCYTFLFLFFFRKKYTKGKNILKLSFLYSAEGNLKYVSQTLHPSSQNTKKKRGGVLHFIYIYIYIYIKHMEICLYTDRTQFQIYNGYLKKKFYAANIANKVTPLILINGGAYVVFRLLGKESRINNRMSLAIVFFKSALTFLRHRNPDSGRSAGLPHPHGALPASRSHQRVYSRDRRPTRQVKTKFESKPKKPEEKEGEEGGGGRWQRPGEPPASGLLVSLLK